MHLEKAACTWLFSKVGQTAIRLIRNVGEAPVKRIGERLGFAGDAEMLACVRMKLNVLQKCQVLMSRRNVTRAGETLYRLGARAEPVVRQCDTAFEARCKTMEAEIAAFRARADELAQELVKERESFSLRSSIQ